MPVSLTSGSDTTGSAGFLQDAEIRNRRRIRIVFFKACLYGNAICGFYANVGFSQWSLSIFGYPEAVRMDGNLGMAMLFEYFPLEREVRVQQPPKIRKTFGGPEREKST